MNNRAGSGGGSFSGVDIKNELSKIESVWSSRLRTIKKNLALTGSAPTSALLARADASKPSSQNLEIILDSRFEELKKEIRALSEQCVQMKIQGAAELQMLSNQVASFELRIQTLDRYFAENSQAVSEIGKLEASINQVRQDQSEAVADDRGKLKMDYLDFKQEVKEKINIMQRRFEGLIAAHGTHELRSSEPLASWELNNLSHLSSISPEEKSFLQKLLEWWSEPLLTLPCSKKQPKLSSESDPTAIP